MSQLAANRERKPGCPLTADEDDRKRDPDRRQHRCASSSR
jgi:hypothetical protein